LKVTTLGEEEEEAQTPHIWGCPSPTLLLVNNY